MDASYFTVNQKTGLSPFQNMLCYLGGSAIQTVGDNPVTAYRQMVQQFAKNAKGEIVSPKEAANEAKAVFRKNPASASLSGLQPRMVGVLLKRIPKFGFFLGYDFITGGKGEPGMMAATAASICSAPFINPVRMVEKQQRAKFKEMGREVSVMEILKESKQQNFKPLFRGTVPLMGHSLASALLGLVGQPKLQKSIQRQLGENGMFSQSTSNLVASAIVSPIYVVVTNPLSRLEVIQQTSSIQGKAIGPIEAVKELVKDSKSFGIKGLFRGQGVGLGKAIISLSLFHEGRMWLTNNTKAFNGY